MVDDEAGRLFVGEENVGLWVFNVLTEDTSPKSIDTVSSGAGRRQPGPGSRPELQDRRLARTQEGAGAGEGGAVARPDKAILGRMPPEWFLGAHSCGGIRGGAPKTAVFLRKTNSLRPYGGSLPVTGAGA